jgi:hypothetical protein
MIDKSRGGDVQPFLVKDKGPMELVAGTQYLKEGLVPRVFRNTRLSLSMSLENVE